MKRIVALMAPVLITGALYAQQEGPSYDEKSLFETLSKVEKKTDKFNFFLNTHAAFNADFNGGDFTKGAFNMKQLRIEARGNVNDWIFYRWRQRLNRQNDGSSSLDNLPKSIDIASVGFKVAPNFSIIGGKMCTMYGGIEFDLNPIEIYEYSDMIEYMDNFLTGVNFVWNASPSHEVALQILDARNNSFEATYGNVEPGITDTKLPLVYTLNWNGTFAKHFNTRWSATVMNQAKDVNMYYFALGNGLDYYPFNTFIDVMYARQGLDRKGIMTNVINNEASGRPGQSYTAQDVDYLSFVWHFNYRVAPKWNLFAKAMYETQGLANNDNIGREKGLYRTSYGYQGGVEYYPMKSNLHFFLMFLGRSYDFQDRAKDLGFKNYNTAQLSTGFIYQLKMF